MKSHILVWVFFDWFQSEQSQALKAKPKTLKPFHQRKLEETQWCFDTVIKFQIAEMHSHHLTKYPEWIILELLSKESYCQNMQLLLPLVLENYFFFFPGGFIYLLIIIVLVLFVHFIQCAKYFCEQNKIITWWFIWYQSLNLSLLIL